MLCKNIRLLSDAAQKALLLAPSTSERALRGERLSPLAGLLPQVSQRPRKQLTPEQLEERRKKV